MKPERIQLAAADLPRRGLAGWRQERNTLRRTIAFPSVHDALALVELAATHGDGRHDVTIELRGTTVTLTLTGSPTGAFTRADLAFARRLEPEP